MQKPGIIAALLASTLIVAGCGQTEEKAATADNAANSQAAAETTPQLPAQNTTAPEGVMTSGTTQQEFSIVNNTGRTVTRLSNSAANENDWSIDLLAMQPVPNGETAQTNFGRGADQCLWDFRATFEDGGTREWRGVNLCEVSTVTLTPS